MNAPKRFFIVDAMALAFRSYHAFSARPLTTSAGLPVSAIYGTAMFLLKLIEEERPDYLAIASDSREPTFRHELYPEYKSNRTEMPPDLAIQIPGLFDLFAALGLPLIKQAGLEADDLIGTMVKRFASKSLRCFIVSGDKDFLQLISPYVNLYSPKKGGEVVMTDEDGVFAKFGCRPEQVIDVLALVGDTSDHVPGVPGIGDKGAAKLIAQFGSLENVYNHLEEVKNQRQRLALESYRQQAYLSKELVTIKCDVEIREDLEDFHFDAHAAMCRDELLALVEGLEFGSITKRLKSYRQKSQSQSIKLVAVDEFIPFPEEVAPPPIKPKPTKPFPHRLVRGAQQIQNLAEEILQQPCFAFDTETTGLDCVSDVPIGISFCWAEDQAAYVPLTYHQGEVQIPEAILAILRGDALKIAHNLKFDLQMLRNVGIDVNGPFADTMIASYLLEPQIKGHSLDHCAQKYLDHKMIPISELIGADKSKSMLDVPVGELSRYACEDSWACLMLYQKLQVLLDEQELSHLFKSIEMPLVHVLASMEQRGVFVDPEVLGRISNEIAAKIATLETDIFAMAGSRFNLNSTKQLQKLLFEELKIQEQLGIKRIKKTKSGFSTDSSVLEQLSEHPIPKAMLEYRMLSKLKNTYVDSLPQLIHPMTSRLHTSFHQSGTATGRLSSSDPNLQNIPIRSTLGRSIRQAFAAHHPDWRIISADYSQIELRLLAHLADEEALIDAFSQGLDIHKATASKIFGIPLDQVDTDKRSSAKAINFGIIYGMGPQRLARETGVDLPTAKEFIHKYFEGFPKISEYIQHSIAMARDRGYALTMSGRRRPIAELKSENPGLRVNAENIAVNSPVQGSAADLIKMAMVAIHKSIRDQGELLFMTLQVHDELVFECHKDYLDEASALIKDKMQNAAQLKVPLLVELGIGQNWLEAH